MSGGQIGSVIGGVIGAYFGGPVGAQIGMAVGGAIGGAVDPTKINGPHIGDGQQQSATDGTPIAWVMGTAKIAGTVVWAGDRYEVKIKDSGKGGPSVSHYESRQSFAICVCESSEIRNSTVEDILMVEQDGVIVYDARPGSTMISDSQKWKENIDFLFGGEDQLPHPTIEADVGTDSTPAYRGRLMMVATDFDIYSPGDRVPSFSFVVRSAGTKIGATNGWWKYNATLDPVGGPYTIPDGITDANYYDSWWATGRAPFGNLNGRAGPGVGKDAHIYDSDFPKYVNTFVPLNTRTWLRRKLWLSEAPESDVPFVGYFDNGFKLWINGSLVISRSTYTNEGFTTHVPRSVFRKGTNQLVCQCDDQLSIDSTGKNVSYFVLKMDGDIAGKTLSDIAGMTLSDIAGQICRRGGLEESHIDAGDVMDEFVLGYPIARQCTGTDALRPLLQAYFCFGSEYDGQLHFHKFGEDATLTVDPAHLIIGNDATEGAIQQTTRNQATEFPRKVTGQYTDPDQNYNAVTVTAERNAIDVIAIGEQQFDIPVVMEADDAIKAVDKALKVAYATLEGTRDYVVPFAYGTTDYIAAVAGMPLLMDGKRWVLDDLTVGNNFLKFSTRYDRQSAYTSNIQAIKGIAPTPPVSRYGGPTDMMVMNLPLLQSKDTVGVYVAVKGSDPGWRRADIQISYDDKESWQPAVTANLASVFGTVVDVLPSSGEPLVVDVDDGVLENVTSGQLAGGANAFAVANGSEQGSVGQFQYAEQDSLGDWELTSITDGLKGSAPLAPDVGDQFMILENVYLVPIDASYDGKTIWLRATANGEKPDEQTPVSIVFHADTTTYIDGGTPGDDLPPPA